MSQTSGMKTSHARIANPYRHRMCAFVADILSLDATKGKVQSTRFALAPLGESPGNLRAWLGVWFWWSLVTRQQVVDQAKAI
jgi:hypothetical protein